VCNQPNSEQVRREKRRAELHAGLPYFTGSETWWKHWLGDIIYTDGVKFLADKGGAYWLIDAIASHQTRENRQANAEWWDGIQFWKLEVHSDHSATLTCVRDTDEEPAVRQEIPYTDFPLEKITLYLCEKTLLLPSEY
jgi:hypothetical protein